MRQTQEMKKTENVIGQARRSQAYVGDRDIAEDVERLQKGLDALKRSIRFSELSNRINVIRAIASAARLGDDTAISHMLNFIVFLDGILEHCKEDVCEGFKKYLSDLFKYKGEGYDVFEALYDEIREDLRYTLERAKKHHAEQVADDKMHA